MQTVNIKLSTQPDNSFKHKRYSHDRTLSSYVWRLKKTLDVIRNMQLSVVRFITPYSNISNLCLLYLYEKSVIVTFWRQIELLNKWSELFCKCRDENKYLSKTFKWRIFLIDSIKVCLQKHHIREII